jgi:cell wall-associated NlpC family hydrolase
MNDQWINDDTKIYGIISISVANLRRQPVFQSELLNQIILGTIIPIYEERNDFYFIQNWDGYWGWVNKHGIVVGDRKMAENWQNSSRVMFNEIYGVVRKDQQKEAEIITDLVPCAVLKKLESSSTLTKVGLPNGKTGYVNSNLIVDEKTLKAIQPTKEDIIKLSKKFLGIPYLWGGNSSKGFDCSGFVQTVFRLLNIELPRDASQMANIGREVAVKGGLTNFEIGDLLFYGKTLKRINHVSIYIGNGLFIHSRGSICLNSLAADHPLYDDYLCQLCLKAQRII